MNQLTEGTFLRWIDQEPGQKPLGVVISPPSSQNEELLEGVSDAIWVLMADDQGNTDLEVFVPQEEATGFNASNLVQQSMEIIEDGDPELIGFLRIFGPNWWQISAHMNGDHADYEDPECLVCQNDSSLEN